MKPVEPPDNRKRNERKAVKRLTGHGKKRTVEKMRNDARDVLTTMEKLLADQNEDGQR